VRHRPFHFELPRINGIIMTRVVKVLHYDAYMSLNSIFGALFVLLPFRVYIAFFFVFFLRVRLLRVLPS